MALKIDAHHHLWRIDAYDSSWMVDGFAKLRRDYLPSDLEPHLEARGIDKTVFVQAQHSTADNQWVLDLTEQYDWIAGVVGWLDPLRDDFEEQLTELNRHPRFCGLRHLIQSEPDDDFALRDDFLASLTVLQKHGVPFDLLFLVRHLRHAKTLAARFPDLPLVIDHLAKPHIADRRMDDWIDELRAAALHENVFCKLSGMVTEATWDAWTPADLQPYVTAALEAFGPERCMFGSDWPVCEVAATYEQVHDALAETIAALSPAENDAVLGGTAARFYGLDR